MGQKKHKYKIELTQPERAQLNRLTTQGSTKVRKLNRAKILLLADENHSQGGMTDKEIAQKLDTSPATVGRIRQKYVKEGLEGALSEKPRSGKPSQITGEERAKITAIACSEPIEGYAGWSLRLIAKRTIELEIVDTISHKTVGEILKKNELKPHLVKSWCIGSLTPTFISQMEMILGIYAQPYDPMMPLWCFDERPCMLIGDKLVPLPLEPGKPKRQNYEYERHGTCSVLFAVQPHTGLCFAQVRKQRTGKDYAHFTKALVDAHCPKKGKIRAIQDNLNTHHYGSFYRAFEPDVAYDLMNKVDIIHTPKKASWLNMAEIQLSVLSRQCLNRRIPSIDDLRTEVLTWVERRNQNPVPIRWQFTPELAREKFKRHYPNLS